MELERRTGATRRVGLARVVQRVGAKDVLGRRRHRDREDVLLVRGCADLGARLGDGTVDPQGFGRYCLTVSSATSPLGPFHDITGNHPLYCDPDPGGSIDPSPYVDPATGQVWMTWKANGRRSSPGVTGYPSSLKTVRLNSSGHFTGPIYTLLTTNEGSWEGLTIENPSMVHWHKRWYLFYSGNSFLADRAGHSPYATGYAIRAGRPVRANVRARAH